MTTEQTDEAAPGKAEAQTPPELRGARRWTTIVTALAAAMMTLDITVVNVALPRIGAVLHASLDSLQWVVNAYTLSFAALLLTVGSVSDRIGRRRIFLAGVAVFTVSSGLCALAPNVGVLIAARTAQGVGGAMAFGTSLALIAGAFEGAPARARTTAIGMFTAGGAVSAALGPLVGGSIVQWLSWPYIFAVNVPIGVLVVVATARKVPESVASDARARIDYLGAVLAVPALFAVNYGLLAGAEKGWTAPDVLVALVGGVVFTAAFIIVQWRLGAEAMLDLRMFAIPTFSGAVLLSFAARIISFGLLPYLTLWMSGMLHLTPFRIGLVLLSQSLAMMVGAVLSSVLAKYLPVARVLGLGMAVVGVGLFLAVGIGPDDGWPAVIPMLLLVGAGAGLVLPHLLDLAVGVVPAAQAGTASGAANSFFPLGTATGVAVFGIVVTSKVTATMSASALGSDSATASKLHSLIAAGEFDTAGSLVPAAARIRVLSLAHSAYTDALSTIFVIAGIAAVVTAVASLFLVRAKDVLAAQSRASTADTTG